MEHTGLEASKWEKTTESVKRGVVSLEYYRPHPFDGAVEGPSRATGFLVENGFIVTNRHVVSAGPFCGRCKFYDGKEVRLIKFSSNI
jgi:pro-apoptotic serine protease NMA111